MKGQHARGMTLVELLVGVAILTLLMIGINAIIRIMLVSSVQQPLAQASLDDVQKVTTNFLNEVRNGTAGNDGSYALLEASSTEIIFFSKYGSAGSTTANRIRYYYVGGTLYRGVTTPSGSPSVYNTANESTTTVARQLGNSTTTVFSYYDGNYAGTSTALAQPVNINEVTYVQISLMPQFSTVRGATTTYLIETGTAVRNLKTNLGN